MLHLPILSIYKEAPRDKQTVYSLLVFELTAKDR